MVLMMLVVLVGVFITLWRLMNHTHTHLFSELASAAAVIITAAAAAASV